MARAALLPPLSLFIADPKVLHNIAVAEYVQGGQRDARKLLSSLEALKQRLEDARAEAEYGEGDAVGDMDPSLTAYNMAVLLFQLKQFRADVRSDPGTDSDLELEGWF